MELNRLHLMALLVIVLLGNNAQAARLSILPESQDAVAGNNFTISVMLDPEGSEVYGAQFSLIFDKTRIEALRIDKGTLLGTNTIEGVKSIDNTNGKVTYSLSRSGTSTGVNSSGTLAVVTLRGLNAGVTAINFANMIISSPNATEIPGTTSGGNVNVSGFVTPTSTIIQSTPTPAINQTSTETSSSGSTGSVYPTAVSKTTASPVIENNKLELTHPDSTVITLSPAGSVPEGGEFEVNVFIRSTEPVYGAELKLSFDNTFLEGINLEQGTFFGGSLVVNSVDNEKGEMTYAETRIGNVAGVKAKGILAKAVFRAKRAGSAAIQPKDIKLVNENEEVVKDVLYSGMDVTILKKTEEPRGADAVGGLWVLVALVVMGLSIKRM
ncbi:MAG: cohesin domain-containing protein [Candidatus Methanoperedens sp.]|nr:cohesin domain-containing protein [Candidatus Methanoperedens sp.]